MAKHMLTFEEFVNEGKLTIKRKYTDAHPSHEVSSNAPIREKILSFVKEGGTVTHEELMEFIAGMNEGNGIVTGKQIGRAHV